MLPYDSALSVQLFDVAAIIVWYGFFAAVHFTSILFLRRGFRNNPNITQLFPFSF